VLVFELTIGDKDIATEALGRDWAKGGTSINATDRVRTGRRSKSWVREMDMSKKRLGWRTPKTSQRRVDFRKSLQEASQEGDRKMREEDFPRDWQAGDGAEKRMSRCAGRGLVDMWGTQN